jgi:hypothetical protein
MTYSEAKVEGCVCNTQKSVNGEEKKYAGLLGSLLHVDAKPVAYF